MILERDGAAGWRVRTRWNDDGEKALVKAAGLVWQPSNKVWTTRSATSALTLLDSLRPIDVVDDKVAGGIRASASAVLAASRATDSDIAVPAPNGLEYLPYQRGGIAFLRERLADGGAALLADEMGLGKTIQVIGFMNTMLADPRRGGGIVRTLVIAPKIALLNWKAELEKWLTKPHSIAVWTSGMEPEADIVIVNYDIVSKLRDRLAAWTWDLLVCDESHALKDSKARRTRAVLGGKGTNPIPAHRRIFVTGTPILNRPIELFPVLKASGVDFARDYYAFARKYCNGRDTKFGFDASGASNLADLQSKLRESVMVRRLKADVLTELPAKRRQVVTIEPMWSEDIRKALRDEARALAMQGKAEAAASAAVARAEQADDKAAYDAAVQALSSLRVQSLAAIAELRQRTALAKVPYVIEAVTEALDSVPDAVLVFAHHKEVVARLADGLRAAGHQPAVITGETSMEERQQAQDDIQQGRKRVFIGSIQACGVAITLTAASTVLFAELDWTPGRMVQAEDRAHRIGQHSAVLVQYLVVDGSIDADMLQKTWTKAFNANAALDVVPESGSAEEEIPVTIEATATRSTEGEISVTTDVTEIPRVEVDAPALDPAGTMEMISVTDAAPEISVKRKRGRPPKVGGAMTVAERSRRYRQSRRSPWQDRRVDLYASTVERAEKLAAEQGGTVASVIDRALRERSIEIFGGHYELAKAAAVKAGEDVEFMVNFALFDISDRRWDEIAERKIR